MEHRRQVAPDPDQPTPANENADELLKNEEESRVQEAELAQPLSTAIQIALVDVLGEFGIRPTSVVGHSSGEIAAAYASGAISAEVAIAVSYFRGQAIKKAGDNPGAMAAVGLAPAKARKYLVDGVTIACENSPQSITLSGDEEKVVQVLKQIQQDEPDTFSRRLKVSKAYHSREST